MLFYSLMVNVHADMVMVGGIVMNVRLIIGGTPTCNAIVSIWGFYHFKMYILSFKICTIFAKHIIHNKFKLIQSLV